MDDSTDTLTRPAVFPPPTSHAVDPFTPAMPWPGQISQAAPMLPTAAVQAPRPAASEIDPFTMFSALTPQPAKQSHKTGGARRSLSWLFFVAVLGVYGVWPA